MLWTWYGLQLNHQSKYFCLNPPILCDKSARKSGSSSSEGLCHERSRPWERSLVVVLGNTLLDPCVFMIGKKNAEKSSKFELIDSHRDNQWQPMITTCDIPMKVQSILPMVTCTNTMCSLRRCCFAGLACPFALSPRKKGHFATSKSSCFLYWPHGWLHVVDYDYRRPWQVSNSFISENSLLMGEN